MLSVEDNQLLSSVGPGTPMGNLMRRYWLPALLSDELPVPDCPPVRLRLLGEELVAFRDTEGRVGVLEEGCPHRRASLWLGRNEESGLRCVYHGWKFDVSGRCLDQMNEPESFADKIRAVAYDTYERGGIVWTYMGPTELKPPPPDFEYVRVPEHKRAITKVWEECGWLQALEGGIDSSHAPILHRNFVTPANDDGRAGGAMWRSGPPLLEVDETDYGYRYAGIRSVGPESQYVRAYHFVLPFTQLRPGSAGIERIPTFVSGHHWVPIDDYNCMVWNWHYSYGDDELTEQYRTMERDGDSDRFVNRHDQFRAYGNRRNDWNIDREAQKKVSFTGIEGIHAQDRAVQESMGAIVQREREHLGPADRAIIVARRILLDEVQAVAAGKAPRGLSESYYNLRSIERIFPKEQAWRDVLLPLMYPEQRDAVEAAVG